MVFPSAVSCSNPGAMFEEGHEVLSVKLIRLGLYNLGQIERVDYSRCKNNKKLELSVAPLSLLAYWPARRSQFHFKLPLMMNWGNHLHCGALTWLCDLYCVKENLSVEKRLEGNTKSFSPWIIWRVEFCMLCFLPSTSAFIIGRALSKPHLFYFPMAL